MACGNKYIYFGAILCIFTFFIPLFLSSIPNIKHYKALENVSVTLGFTTSQNETIISIACQKDNIEKVYVENKICVPPEFSMSKCGTNNELVQVYLVDMWYVRNGKKYRDSATGKLVPVPFHKARLQEFCSYKWIYDPITDIFKNCDFSECNLDDYDTSIICVSIWGSFLGILPICFLVSILDILGYVFSFILNVKTCTKNSIEQVVESPQNNDQVIELPLYGDQVNELPPYKE